jgi:hypothetical protein
VVCLGEHGFDLGVGEPVTTPVRLARLDDVGALVLVVECVGFLAILVSQYDRAGGDGAEGIVERAVGGVVTDGVVGLPSIPVVACLPFVGEVVAEAVDCDLVLGELGG